MDERHAARELAASPLGWLPGDPAAAGRRSRQRRAAADERRFLQRQEPRPTQGRERWRLIVRGQVQGVGYRAGCRRRAEELRVSGWVRNCLDGSVEVEAEGLPRDLGELQLWCERGPLGAHVSGASSTSMAPTGSDWFEIRH